MDPRLSQPRLRQSSRRWKALGSLVFGLTTLLHLGLRASLAQVLPDGSLGTVVVPDTAGLGIGAATDLMVQGGQRSGALLFHSFDQFSVPNNHRVNFVTDPSIEAIFARVTGASASQIDGGLVATTDLYLLNSRGIQFGPTASLQVGGSFTASTAEALVFADGFRFDQQLVLNLPPLLTLQQPLQFQLGSADGPLVDKQVDTQSRLVNRSQALNGAGVPVGLAVPPGETLRLVGAEIELDQGNLTAPSGRLELVGDRILLQQSRLLADSLPSAQLPPGSNLAPGGIYIRANQLELRNQALLSSLALGDRPGGKVEIEALDSVRISGSGYENLENTLVFGTLQQRIRPGDRTQLTGITTGTVGSGDSGAIELKSRHLQLEQGAILWAPSFGSGQGGDIQLSVEQLDHWGSAIATSAYGAGASGELRIRADRFTLADSAFIDTSTFSPASGGNITIAASQLRLLNSKPGAVLPTSIFSASLGSSGAPGDVMIQTDRLWAEDGAHITSTGGARFRIIDVPRGGQSGNVTIVARDRIDLVGQAPDGLPTQISTTNYAQASAGQLQITTPLLRLDRGARLLALAEQGEGGNIELNLGAIALLQNGSEIAATALAGSGNGGNIQLTAPLLLLQDSAIRANATGGLGGEIHIETNFLGQARSVISASSQLGQAFGGSVELTQPEVKPTQNRHALTMTPMEGEDAIATACTDDEDQRFVISGRSGIPQHPLDPLGSPLLWRDQRLGASTPGVIPPSLFPSSPASSPVPREALGWRYNHRGQVVLWAAANAMQASRSPNCRAIANPIVTPIANP